MNGGDLSRLDFVIITLILGWGSRVLWRRLLALHHVLQR